MARKDQQTRDKSRANLRTVFEESKLSQGKFAESISTKGWQTNQQTVQRYLSGENDMNPRFAKEVARVYRCRVAWLLGESDDRTEAEHAAAIAEANERWTLADEEKRRKMAFFELLVQLSGWHFAPLPEGTIHRGMDIAAPYGESDSTVVGIEKLKNFVRIGDGVREVTISQPEYNNLMERMLGHFNFEMEHTRFESEALEFMAEHGLENR